VADGGHPPAPATPGASPTAGNPARARLLPGLRRDAREPGTSCKGRGFCPSCGGRRMAERAANLIDAVLPPVPFRQWVLSLPFALRYRMAYDHDLCRAALAVTTRALIGFQRRRAKKQGVADPHSGTVTVIQRFGSGLRLNVHFHILLPDGVFAHDASTGTVTFVELPRPTDADVAKLLLTIARRIARLLDRRGLLTDPFDDQADEAPTLAALQQASIRGVRALGPEAGRLVARLRNPLLVKPPASDRPLHAHLEGFDLHAAVAIDADDRDALERLCRYLSRPAIAQDRLELRAGDITRVTLRHPWSDGTTHLDFTPPELIARLAAFIPRPGINLVLYHGVFAPNAKLRRAVVSYGRDAPVPATRADDEAARTRPTTSPPRYWAWADLMRRAFGIDVLECPNCGGRMRVLATIIDPKVINAILEHRAGRGPPAQPPPPPVLH
jgi:Putative transposase/Transposase zinc-binding domain